MTNINYICVDGKEIGRKHFIESVKLLKIVKSYNVIADHLLLVVDKRLYKEPKIRDTSIIDLKMSSRGMKNSAEDIDTFYLDKKNEALNINYLNDTEQDIVKDPNNITFHGLSVNQEFLSSYRQLMNLITGDELLPDLKGDLLKDKTLQQALEYMKQSLSLDEGLIMSENLDFKLPYFVPSNFCLNEDSNYSKAIFEELADIFYATSNIRNNKLYFMQKGSYNLSIIKTINLSPEEVISKEYIKKRLNKNDVEYRGVEYSYFEKTPNNIKHLYQGRGPFLKLDKVYEKTLADIYSYSKLREINEYKILKLTVRNIQNKNPGCYLRIRKSKAKATSDKDKCDFLGYWLINDCIIAYRHYEQSQQDPSKPGPSAKKAKLDPYWCTTLKLIKVNENKK